jgi:hypothetical protein
MENLQLSEQVKLMSEQVRMLIDLDEANQKDSLPFGYHRHHIDLVCEYALIINERLNAKLDKVKLASIAYAHDLFKEVGLDIDKEKIFNGKIIPQDIKKYISENKDVLDEYGMKDYVENYTDHAVASAIYLIEEYNIKDKDIIYGILFHSCPIIPIYERLDEETKMYVDIITLSDKLSSNYIQLNSHMKVRCNLEEIVFGKNGNEFNYTLGLFLARMISKGKDKDPINEESLEYYRNRLKSLFPFFPDMKLKDIGEKRKWEKSKSKVLKSVKNDSSISGIDVK